jgi:DNA-binding transcriptional LysR family regulator
MDRLETRELSYFVAVAEELHFGRAAQRLGMAQPPLSRAIRQLERRMGVTLLERSSRRVVLTAAGEVLLHEGRRALDAMSAATARAQRAGRTDPRLVLVMKPSSDGGLLPDILAEFERAPEAIAVDILTCGIGEQAGLLRDGHADVGLLHGQHQTPEAHWPQKALGRQDLSGLDTEELMVERQVVILPAGHRLAGRAAVCMVDLSGEAMPAWPGTAEGSDGKHDAAQLLQLIALGRAIAVVPESARRQVRRDLVCVPVLDAAPTTVLIAWPEHSRSTALAAFVRAATTLAAAYRSAQHSQSRHGPDQGGTALHLGEAMGAHLGRTDPQAYAV